MKIAQDVTQLIGNTPLIKLNTPSQLTNATILAKCEFMNPTSSVKDRVGAYLIHQAIMSNQINQETTIIEPTSGNTGIALASVCAAKGLKLILTMPESMSIERQKLLRAFGATLVLTPAKDGMNGAIHKANQLHKEIQNSIILQQFQNENNPKSHSLTTAQEILQDTNKQIDAFIAAIGTGGTFTGVSRILQQEIPDIRCFAVEPDKSPVLSGGQPAPHKIQGIGAGFIPDILDTSLYHEVIRVKDEDAINTAKMLAQKEGLLVGISAGANVYATMQIASRPEFQGKTLVTILCDTGERYLSTELFDEA
ncbi:Cysteine synthase [hydrothermal vent metagenome]|uniref:cysteine synthase n=1 Tax=hydrothermal vent metagenome TaxID=652676 RepID=A0A1W1D4G8_9ZZZZ